MDVEVDVDGETRLLVGGGGRRSVRGDRAAVDEMTALLAALLAAGGEASLCGAVLFQYPHTSLGGDPHQNRTTLRLLMYAGVLVSAWVCLSLALATLQLTGFAVAPTTARRARIGAAVALVAAFGCLLAWPSFSLAMYVSSPFGVVYIAALCLGMPKRVGRVRASLAWVLTGLVVSLLGYGLSALLGPQCYSGVLYQAACPLPKSFDQEALYHVLQAAGYTCFWMAAAVLQHG